MTELLAPLLAGLSRLRERTQGDPRVVVALLDGPVDRSHPALRGQSLRAGRGGARRVDLGPATNHGTGVASLIFGRPGSTVPGLAPRCAGLVIPIFDSEPDGAVRPCSQLDLARALVEALEAGAHLINVSGGEFTPSGAAHPYLLDAVRECARRGALIVAAAGNQGCECLHVPAALNSVLAVGATDSRGEPLPFSNWGGSYQTQGIVAPGDNLLVAEAGGGTARRGGTSYAAAVVTGVAALLLSEQLARGQGTDPRRVRRALLDSAVRCDARADPNCPRRLAGRLNIPGALSVLFEEPVPMSEVPSPPPTESGPVSVSLPPLPAEPPASVYPSGCGCSAPGRKVYALGMLGFDLVGEARADSLAQGLAATLNLPPSRGLAHDHRNMLAHLDRNPWESTALEWTLSLEGGVLYAIRPQGAFANDTYALLRTFLKEQLDEGVERISLPGTISGTARLFTGQVVPVVVPERRGMYSWSTKALAEAAVSGPEESREQIESGVRNFLDRVYYGHRNLGVLPQDRALNFAATNAFNFEKVYEAALKDRMELESIQVTPSPYCRPGSDCWDVEVYFFYPDRAVQNVRKVYRFTVDVSDAVPATVGPTRSWFTR